MFDARLAIMPPEQLQMELLQSSEQSKRAALPIIPALGLCSSRIMVLKVLKEGDRFALSSGAPQLGRALSLRRRQDSSRPILIRTSCRCRAT